jgi:hypothetical protein
MQGEFSGQQPSSPSPDQPGDQRFPHFRNITVAAVLGGCAMVAGAVAVSASANGNIGPPTLPGMASPSGLPRQVPTAGVPTGLPTGLLTGPGFGPGNPSRLPSVPATPSGFPSIPHLPTDLPSVPGMPTSLPTGASQ